MKHLGRKVSFGLAAVLGVGGALLLVTGLRWDRAFERWKEERPVEMAIDLSRPGEVAATFRQTCELAHGETLDLLLPEDDVARPTWLRALDDVRFVCRVVTQDGEETLRREFTGERPWEDAPDRGAVALVSFAPFENGTYRLVLSVTQGAPALAGVPQRLFGRYHLCGLERLPVPFFLFGGTLALFVAAVLAATTLVVIWAGRGERGDRVPSAVVGPEAGSSEDSPPSGAGRSPESGGS